VIRHEHDPVPVTQTELADPQDGNHPEFRELLAAYDHYDTKPAFQTFDADEMHRVWVKLSTREDLAQAEWLIRNR